MTAAPLIVDKANLKATGGKVRVVAINAGNANCAAGQAGLDAARATCVAVAKEFEDRAERQMAQAEMHSESRAKDLPFSCAQFVEQTSHGVPSLSCFALHFVSMSSEQQSSGRDT